MKLAYLFVWMMLLQVNLHSENAPTEKPLFGSSDLNSLVQSNNELSFEIYRLLIQNQTNLVFSPYSLSTALQMLYAGSAGLTRSQMSRVLHFVLPPEKLNAAARELAEALVPISKKNYEDFVLSIGNSLWVNEEHPILSEFEQIISQKYRGIVKSLDFQRKPDASRAEINEWVKSQTRGRITNLFAPNEISSMTRLVLVSTLYMIGRWKNAFDPKLTRPMPFFPSPLETITVPMMSLTASLPYAKNDQFAIAELPYYTKATVPKIAMYIVLPSKIFGLGELERKLSSQQLLTTMRDLKPKWLTVSLPKFKMTNSLDIKAVLEKMELIDPFGTRADFSKIDGSQDLQVSQVLQKVYFSIDEKGTEGGVATGVTMELKSVNQPAPDIFLVDHPFLFFVVDKETGAFVFMGRVTEL